MAGGNPARLFAPLALAGAVIGVVVVIAVSRAGTTTSSDAPSIQRTATRESRPVRAPRRVYVVKAGDTLTVIADKTDVTLETIERLNPDVDPQALQTGQRLKLTP